MKRIYLLILLAIVIALISVFYIKRLGFVETKHDISKRNPDKKDLGDLLQFHSREHVFCFRNSSREAMRVTHIDKSCGCTEAVLDAEIIPPGGETDLKAILNAQDRAGLFGSKIIVYWQLDPSGRKGQTDFSLYAKAVRLVSFDPATVDFGEINQDEKNSRFEQKLLIYRGEAKVPWDDISVVRAEGMLPVRSLDADTFEVTIPFSGCEYPIGNYKDELVVQLKKQGKFLDDTFKIPLLAKIVSNLEATPTSVFIGVVAPDGVKEGKFWVHSKTDEPLEIVLVETSDQKIMKAVFQAGRGGSRWVNYTFDSHGQTANVSGKFLIKVRLEGKVRELAVPYIAYIK